MTDHQLLVEFAKAALPSVVQYFSQIDEEDGESLMSELQACGAGERASVKFGWIREGKEATYGTIIAAMCFDIADAMVEEARLRKKDDDKVDKK